MVSAVCCVFLLLVCYSSCLSHLTPGPHLQSCSPGLHPQSTPFINPWIPCCRRQIVLRTTVITLRAWRLCYLLPRSRTLVSCCFWTASNFCSSACRYPDHSLKLAHLALPAARSSTTCFPPCSINPFCYPFNIVSVCSWVQHRRT